MWTKRITIKKINPRGTTKQKDQIVIEKKTILQINKHINKHLYHTPTNETELIKGYITSQFQKQIKSIKTTKEQYHITLSDQKIPAPDLPDQTIRFHDTLVFNLTAKFQEKAILFKETAICESASIANTKELLHFAEDIHSESAFYKVIGQLTTEEIKSIQNYILLVSFKLTESFITMCKNLNIKHIITRTAPTSTAYDIAQSSDIKLIGFARGTKYSIYT